MILYTVLSTDYPHLKKYAEKFNNDDTIDSYYFCKDKKDNFYYRLKRLNKNDKVIAEEFKKVM